MKMRKLGRTGIEVSEIGLGTWQVGGRWGTPFSHGNADAILHKAVDLGVNFIDTADVYGDGESEKAVGRLVRNRPERIYIATKCGRRLEPHTKEAYTPNALRGFVEDSLDNTGLEQIDLVQLHCPPNEVYYRPEIFGLFNDLIAEGKVGHLGVSVEKVEQALKAIEYDNVDTVQIIFNIFRQRPAGLFFEQAKKRDIGVIIRVPLASGLLTGTYTRHSEFEKGDHRRDNREGELFDKGETFAGLDYEDGLEAVKALRQVFPKISLTQLALRWILMFDTVSTVIPGASKVSQVESNIAASGLPPLITSEMEVIREIYASTVKDAVHHRW